MNGFLSCFTADAAFGLAKAFLAGTPLRHLSQPLSSIASSLTLLGAVILVFLICSFRNLRWKILAPALLLVFWESFYLLPLPAYLSWNSLETGLIALKLAVAMGTHASLWTSSNRKSLLLPPESSRESNFSTARTLGTFALKLFVLLPLLVVYVLVSAQLVLKVRSAGFLEVTREGIFTEARTYNLDGRKVYLLPTVHIAAPSFYDTLLENLPDEKSVILPEGVSDKNGVLQKALDYSGPAHSLGLSVQPDLTKKKKAPDAIRSDIDVSEFSPATLEFLQGVGRAMSALKSEDSAAIAEALSSFKEPDLEPLLEDIIHKRNVRVLEGIHSALSNYEHVAVPWGVAHMPEIERELLKQKAQRTDAKRVQVFAWKDIALPFSQ